MATAVTSPQEAAALLSQVRHFFSSRFGFKSLAVDAGAVGAAEAERLSLSAAFDQINVSLMDRPVRRHHPSSCGLLRLGLRLWLWLRLWLRLEPRPRLVAAQARC